MTEAHTERYRGVLAEHDHGEGMDILFLDGEDDYAGEPLAERISDGIYRCGSYLSVRYWTADKPQSDDAMIEGALRELLGAGDATFRHAYSEITGYLWTDEEINVGGHDLLEELRSHLGRYCLLEIAFQKEVIIAKSGQ